MHDVGRAPPMLLVNRRACYGPATMGWETGVKKNLKVWVVAAGLAGAVFGGGAFAFASIPNSVTGIISACLKSSGAVQIIDTQAGKVCNSGEKLLSWNQVGPVGEPGPEGPAGPVGPEGPVAAGGGATTAVLPSFDSGRGGCPVTWAFPSDNCGMSEQIARSFGVAVDPADYPATATFSIELGAFNYSTAPVDVCLRLWNLDTHSVVAGSESCTTIGAAIGPGAPAGTTIASPSFSLPAGLANYALQEQEPYAHAVTTPYGTYYDNLAGLTPYHLRADW